MKLIDLLSVDQWRELEKEIHDRFGMDTNVFDTEGIRITNFKAWVNRLCPEIKATDKGQSFICAVAHMNLAAISRQTSEPVVEECDAGLVKIVVPIFADGQYIGALGACGFMLEDGEVDSYLVNKITGIEEDVVAGLSEGLPAVSMQEARALVAYAQKRIRHIVAARQSGS